MNRRNMLKQLVYITLTLICLLSKVQTQTVGYKIGQVQSYTLLKESHRSKLYRIQDDKIDDGKKLLLLELIGTHYQAGYDYGALIGKQIRDNYQTFLNNAFSTQWQIKLLEAFLDWQYDTFVRKQIPKQFIDQLKGIQKGSRDVYGIKKNKLRMQRGLTIASYPGNFTNDIAYTLLDQFLREAVQNNTVLLNYIEKNLFTVVKLIKDFYNRKRVHCSFFAVWGSRTKGGKLFTMRNLDWNANTGMNKNKLITVWKIDGKIPHTTLGFPVILGALTGMSAAGLTVHEAGLDSMRATQLGFPWTLRLRYIMMNAKNLQQAKKIWQNTNNTLGMNNMIASAVDVAVGEPAFVVQTMRDYTAWFKDNDPREVNATFVDPLSKQTFRSGYAMSEAVFRTNHAYDPKINWYRTKLPIKSQSTIQRYMLLKDGFQYYENLREEIGAEEAINITAIAAHKGGKNAYKCSGDGDEGTNVISVMYVPGDMRMYAGFQYGSNQTYRTACCGVYVNIDMKRWFGDFIQQQKL